MNIELKVAGMSCGHCEAAVLKALKAVEGVSAATVSLSNGSARVEGQNLNSELLIAAVTEEGYTARLAA